MVALTPKVYCGNGKNPITHMTATGTPPHIPLANELVATRGGNEMSEMRTAILQRLEEVPDRVEAVLLENFQVEGKLPITVAQVQTMTAEMQERLVTAILEQGARQHAALEVVQSSLLPNTSSNSDFLTYVWGEGIHPVPQSFRFPK